MKCKCGYLDKCSKRLNVQLLLSIARVDTVIPKDVMLKSFRQNDIFAFNLRIFHGL